MKNYFKILKEITKQKLIFFLPYDDNLRKTTIQDNIDEIKELKT